MSIIFSPPMMSRGAGAAGGPITSTGAPALEKFRRAYVGNGNLPLNTIRDSSIVPNNLALGNSRWETEPNFPRPVLRMLNNRGVLISELGTFDVGNASGLGSEVGVTISIWAKTLDNSTEQRFLTLRPANAPTFAFIFQGGKVKFGVSPVIHEVTMDVTLWNHYAIRINSSDEADWFVNGGLVNNASIATAASIGSGNSYWGASRSNTLGLNGWSIDFCCADYLEDEEIEWLAQPNNQVS